MTGPTGQGAQGPHMPPQDGPYGSRPGAGPTGYPQPGHPQAGYPQSGYPQSGYPQSGYPPSPGGPGRPPGPPPRKSSAGKIIAIVVGVVVVLVVAGAVAVGSLFAGAVNQVGDLAGGAGATCDAVAKSDVDATLGGDYDVVALGGFNDLAGFALDSRVLADAPTCWGVETGDGGRLVRIARYSGADAAQRFATEKATSMGATEDRGDGLTVSTDGYFGGDVQAGDEAFCTSGDMLGSAGALVRRGDLLIYVSTTAAGEGAASVPEIDFQADQLSFATDAPNCQLAVKLAEKTR